MDIYPIMGSFAVCLHGLMINHGSIRGDRAIGLLINQAFWGSPIYGNLNILWYIHDGIYWRYHTDWLINHMIHMLVIISYSQSPYFAWSAHCYEMCRAPNCLEKNHSGKKHATNKCLTDEDPSNSGSLHVPHRIHVWYIC